MDLGQALAAFLQEGGRPDPDRRYPGEDRGLLLFGKLDDRLRVAHPPIREQDLGAGHAARVGQAPTVRVEHRHDRKDRVRLLDGEVVGLKHAHRVDELRAVRVGDALRVAGGA